MLVYMLLYNDFNFTHFRGLEGMCLNNFSEAFQNFKNAVECDPKNSSVSIN